MPSIPPHLLAEGLLAGEAQTWIVVSSLVGMVLAVVLGVRAASRAGAERDAADRRALGERARAEAVEAELKSARERHESGLRGEHPALEALPRALRDIAAAASRQEVVAQLARAVERVIGSRQWMVFAAADDAGAEFVVAASGSEDGSAWPVGARLTSQTGRVGIAVRRRQPIDARDLESEPPIVREQIDSTEPQSFVVDVAVPVVVGEHVAAVATAGGLRQSIGVARAALQCLAEHAVVVLRGLEARERAQRFAHQDPLTGLGNRTWFVSAGAETLFRVRNERGSAALIVFRVRDLDVYVHRNGHAAGDRLVRGIASVLRPVCREGDVLSRWSESEFAILVVGVDEEVARDIASRARSTIASVEWPHAADQPGGRILVETGMASYPGAGETLEDLLDAATASVGRSGARAAAVAQAAPAPAAAAEDEEYIDVEVATRELGEPRRP